MNQYGLCVDGTDPQGNQAGDAEGAPFVIFNIDEQENLAGTYPTRAEAVGVLAALRQLGKNGFGVYGIKGGKFDTAALFAVADAEDDEDGFYVEAETIGEVVNEAMNHLDLEATA